MIVGDRVIVRKLGAFCAESEPCSYFDLEKNCVGIRGIILRMEEDEIFIKLDIFLEKDDIDYPYEGCWFDPIEVEVIGMRKELI